MTPLRRWFAPSPLAGEGRGEGGSPAPREVTIPRQIVVRCPLQRFDLRRAHQCDGCPHFAGLAEAPARPDAGFHERFQVRCAYPTDRTLFRLRD